WLGIRLDVTGGIFRTRGVHLLAVGDDRARDRACRPAGRGYLLLVRAGEGEDGSSLRRLPALLLEEDQLTRIRLDRLLGRDQLVDDLLRLRVYLAGRRRLRRRLGVVGGFRRGRRLRILRPCGRRQKRGASGKGEGHGNSSPMSGEERHREVLS